MFGSIIVAVACNLVAFLIILSGVLTAKRDGFRVTLIKFVLSLGGLVGAFFCTPLVSSALYAVDKVPELLS